MTETDDIVARLHNAERAQFRARDWTWIPVHNADTRRLFIEAATALTDRDAQIERLQEHSAARAQDIITLGQQIERLTRERDEAIREMSEWAAKAGEIEGRLKASEWPGVVEGWKERATTAERDLAEARAERDRLENERAEEWRKRRNAEGDRDVLNAANGTLRKELAEARAEVERSKAVIEEGRRAIGDHFAPNDCYATGPLTGDPIRDLIECPACSFIAMYDKYKDRAVLAKGGADGDA